MSINILRIPPRRPPPTVSNVDLDIPQIMTINQPGAPSSEPDFEEEYVTDDEEVDEIIDDEPPPARKPNGKGKAKATPNNLTPGATPGPTGDPSPPKPKAEKLVPPLPPRKPGESHVDQLRVEKIIKAHGEMLPPSRDAVFLISLAAEEFVKRLASTGHRHASNEHRESIVQRDMALVARLDRGYSFLQETVPTAIPLSVALQKRAQKENERTLIATELTHAPPAVSNGTSSTHSHKKRQPPLPKPQPAPKAKTRTSARQANGRTSTVNNSSNASAGSSAAGTPTASSPRPKRAAAQRGRGSWAQADDEAVEYEDEEPNYPPPVPMEVDEPPAQWRRQSFGSGGAGRGGIMKGFGPGAYGKVGGLAGRGDSGSPPRSRSSWGFPPEPPRNTGRTIYSDRTDEEARKAALEAEEQLRYKRARQKIEQELLTQEAPEPSPGWTSDHEMKEE